VISVVVPAHEEEARIAACLSALTDGAPEGALDIVVIANGCSDGTARAARAVPGPIRVIEIERASKIAALNAGDAAVNDFPRVYVDGDVQIPWSDLRQLVAALEDGATHLAAPERRWVTAGRPWLVRSYLRFLEQLPQVRRTVTGGGVLAISAAGRARFQDFPEVIADDLFLEAQVTQEERRRVTGATSIVETPFTVRGLVQRRTRVERGKLELRELGILGGGASSSTLLGVLRERPRLIVHFPAFLIVTLIVRLRERFSRKQVVWERDSSTR
jgi:hypothetical protein